MLCSVKKLSFTSLASRLGSVSRYLLVAHPLSRTGRCVYASRGRSSKHQLRDFISQNQHRLIQHQLWAPSHPERRPRPRRIPSLHQNHQAKSTRRTLRQRRPKHHQSAKRTRRSTMRQRPSPSPPPKSSRRRRRLRSRMKLTSRTALEGEQSVIAWICYPGYSNIVTAGSARI